MTKIVISERFGGYGLSKQALDWLTERGHTPQGYQGVDLPRDHPDLVQVVEELGKESSGTYADLVVVEIPDGVDWHIHEYDGFESVHEAHRTWGSDGEDAC